MLNQPWGATPPGTASPRSNGIVPLDSGIREAPNVPGPPSASPWTNTLRLDEQDEGGKAASPAADREIKPLLGPCTPTTTNRRTRTYRRPFKRTCRPIDGRGRPFWPRDERRPAITTANGLPLPPAVSSRREIMRLGSLCRLNQAKQPTATANARSPGAKDSRLHPIELSTSPSAARVPLRQC